MKIKHIKFKKGRKYLCRSKTSITFGLVPASLYEIKIYKKNKNSYKASVDGGKKEWYGKLEFEKLYIIVDRI